jgi:phosphoribosyl 1,2-cyclic phosphodiesterase
MAMRFCILGSGSSGNSALIVTEGARILVDAGYSARKLEHLLANLGESLARIDAVFLTHEHGDHSSGIDSLKKFQGLKIFANEATAEAVQERLGHRPDWKIFETGARFRFLDVEVQSFSVPHDARDPVGFRFANGIEGDLVSPRRSIAWLTDLGHAPANIREYVDGCDVVVIEANHCSRLLQEDRRRPWALKQRISGRHGHLSNQAACEFLAGAADPRWRRIYLTHLSRDCNSPAAVAEAFAGSRSTLRCELSIVGPGEGTPFYEFI